MKRLAWVAAGLLLFTACPSDDPTVTEQPAAADKSPARAEEFSSQGDKISIEWQSTVADIEPTSRFREPVGGDDTATISTTVLLSKPADDATKRQFEELQGVTVEFDKKEQLVHLSYRVDVEQIEDGDGQDRYRFEIEMPLEFTELRKQGEEGGDVALSVLLPRPAREYPPGTSEYRVELVSPEDEPEGYQEFDPEEPSQRLSVHFYDRKDPPWQAIYDLLD